LLSQSRSADPEGVVMVMAVSEQLIHVGANVVRRRAAGKIPATPLS
jgi:hypothetical protein